MERGLSSLKVVVERGLSSLKDVGQSASQTLLFSASWVAQYEMLEEWRRDEGQRRNQCEWAWHVVGGVSLHWWRVLRPRGIIILVIFDLYA